jgi:hypothetical protein
MRTITTVLASFTMSLVAAGSARAQGTGETTATATARAPSPLALVAELGWRSGAAIGAELRAGSVGARLTGGGNLIMLSVQDADSHELDSFEIFGTGQVNGEVFAFPIHLDSGTELGLSLAYRYNSLLGSGYGGGFEAQRRVGERSTLRVSAGITYYPDGDDRLMDREEFPDDVDFNFPLGASLQGGLDIALAHDIL